MDIYRSTPGVMEIQLKYFVFFYMYLKDKAFKYLKSKTFLLANSSNVWYVLDIWRDDDDDYDGGESRDNDYYE